MRNPFCKKYDICLEYAAKQDFKFDCSECTRMMTNSVEVHDLKGCHLLLWALFKPDLYRKFRELDQQDQHDAIG